MTDRSWAGAPYLRLYYTLPGRMGVDWSDVAFVGSYVKLLLAADGAFPAAAPLPRWLHDAMLDRLVASGLVRLVGTDSYTIAGLAKERADRVAGRAVGGKRRAADADRDESGRFLPKPATEPASEPATSSNASDDASNESQRPPASQLETSRDERDEKRTLASLATSPGDSVASKLATSRRGLKARRRDRDDLLRQDGDAVRAVAAAKTNGARSEPCYVCHASPEVARIVQVIDSDWRSVHPACSPPAASA